ncbi:MAG: YggT family protein [Synechococcaceae cyanobacterium RM1_1_27]|nr:YggT family protein [Synechococcaceae cyanobacterium SM2_3_2]NJO85919.1 YggT family protein [Synechococcaceae cyanobacterium RM1_1_27]
MTWILHPLLATYIVLFVVQIFLSWYPQYDTSRPPYSAVVWATDFLLKPTRRLIPPIGGVDMSPVIWVGIVSLLREMLLGQQGILTMAMQYH